MFIVHNSYYLNYLLYLYSVKFMFNSLIVKVMNKVRKPRRIIDYYVPTVNGMYVPVLKPVYVELKSMGLNLREKRIDVTPNLINFYLIPE